MHGEIRALYVDDDEAVLESTAEYLAEREDELDVLTETDPERALDRIQQSDIDCLVSDYRMAGMDGLDFLERVRSEFPDLPFIFYTGRGSEEVASEAISNDATGYVQKSASTDDYDLLVNRIRQSVSRYRDRVSYRELFANIGVGVCVRDTETYELVEANQEYCDLLGYDRDRLRGLGFGELTADRGTGGEYSRARAEEMIDRAVETGEHEFEWPYRTGSGGVVWVAVSHRISEIRGTERVLTTLQDITDRKEREDRLKTVNERLDLAVEGAGLGVWDWNIQAGDMAFNDEFAEMVGLDPEEAPPMVDAWRDRIHPDDQSAVREAIEAHNEGTTEYYDTEYRIQTGNDDWEWVQTLGRVVEREDDGTPVRAVGIQMSINERKRYEQQLKQQRDNLETLNQVVRHDIRNDLQVVLAYLDTLGMHADDETEEYIEAAIESAQSAVRLTRTARDLAETMLQAEAEQHPVQLASVLHEQVENLQSTEPNAEVTLEGSIPSRPVVANEMLDSVFRNLLQNAVEHNDKDVAEVTVSVDNHDDTVVVQIADNGPGIPEGQREAIFGKGETGLDSDGSGIGLYLVETLLDQYGGDVWVENDDPEGAVFSVELLAADREQ